MIAPGAVTRWVATALAVTTAVVMIWRMRHGADFTDEAFYLAVPLRFVLGDRPFVDELNITQTGGVLSVPFVKVWTLLVGSATGIVLFARVLYLVFFGLVGFAVFRFARMRLPYATSILIAAACICFIPYGLPGLSYNTWSSGLFTLGLFVSARWLLAPVRPPAFYRHPLLWAGLAHGAAAFAYPTMSVAAVTTACVIAVLAGAERVRATLCYAAGGLLFALIISPVFVSAGVAHLREVVAYTTVGDQMAMATTTRLATLGGAWLDMNRQLALAAFVVAFAMVLLRRWPTLVGLGLPFIPLLAHGSVVPTRNLAVMGFMSTFAVLGPLLCFGLRDRPTARVMLVGIGVPATVSGVITCWTSTNTVLASAIGLYPLAHLASIALAMLVDQTTKQWRLRWLRPPMALSPVIFLYAALGYATADKTCIREAPLSAMTSVVAEGPYKGIYTTPERKAALAELSAAVLANAQQASRALFYFDFPAGYLVSYRRPLITSAWTFALPSHLEPDARFFRERAKPGDLVVRDDARWVSMANATQPPDAYLGAGLGGTPLDLEVAARCDLVQKGRGWSIYRVR
ncbi:MAG: hypothetical protein KF819_30565 [Labilithrix sp.]|nr:hypothetical protein [Labilithrix sp.]